MVKNIFSFGIYSLLISFLFLISCNQKNTTNNSKNEKGSDSITTAEKVTTKAYEGKTEIDKNKTEEAADNTESSPEVVVANVKVDNMSRFISGMKQENENELNKLENYRSWKKYAALSDTVWTKLKANKLKKMSEFSRKELLEANKSSDVLFYPFSGPDFLNMFVFFPNAKKYVMAGLENVGGLPNVGRLKNDSIARRYFKHINTSLNDILNISFFKTKDMAVDFRAGDVTGNLAVILIFMERTGNKILDVNPVKLNSKGEIVAGSFKDTTSLPAKRITGTEIHFKTEKNETKTLYYFSVNLANFAFEKVPYFLDYVRNLGQFNTYIKSASYLMHKAYFSEIRKCILDQSRNILEDDSGIPYKFFKSKKWDIQLYGKYVGPIRLFENHFQKDLDSLYKIPSKVKPLPFGIGYQFRYGQSNLLLAKKK
ncbi:MAG: hypothetical protein Q8880_02825 [Bacteroidota bacterium]|nr:hypothetical protein [Bacteroidota bacterium]